MRTSTKIWCFILKRCPEPAGGRGQGREEPFDDGEDVAGQVRGVGQGPRAREGGEVGPARLEDHDPGAQSGDAQPGGALVGLVEQDIMNPNQRGAPILKRPF